MDPILSCPACGAISSHGWPGLIAPFIAEFVLHAPVEPCRLQECRTCAHRYFDKNFNLDEVDRLYSGYRGAAYFQVRNRHEPWYTQAYNNGIGFDSGRVRARKAALSTFLSAAGLKAPFASVLDFGGDSGQLIPEAWAIDRFVHDLSDVPAVEGVQKLARESELEGRSFELVLLSHVLEHATDLTGLLLRIRSLLPIEGGQLYIEVPFERPWTGLIGQGGVFTKHLDWVRTKPTLLRLLDFYSSAFRIKAGFFPPLGFPNLHAHLHFFSPDSLRQLLTRSGYSTTNLRRVPSAGRGRLDALACLATPVTGG